MTPPDIEPDPDAQFLDTRKDGSRPARPRPAAAPPTDGEGRSRSATLLVIVLLVVALLAGVFVATGLTGGDSGEPDLAEQTDVSVARQDSTPTSMAVPSNCPSGSVTSEVASSTVDGEAPIVVAVEGSTTNDSDAEVRIDGVRLGVFAGSSGREVAVLEPDLAGTVLGPGESVDWTADAEVPNRLIEFDRVEWDFAWTDAAFEGCPTA